ncbi:AGPAT5: 1-acyl-sn-glycerol-3-phosphate acyltransferase epsilon, partial [Crotalus adamanteus]
LTILKHVLTPRVKATHIAVDSMKSYFDAVYEVTIAYEGTVDHKGQRKVAPSMAVFIMFFWILDLLYKECPRIYIYIELIELKDIPEEQMFMRRWLHEFFFRNKNQQPLLPALRKLVAVNGKYHSN